MYRDILEVECIGGTRLRLTFEGGDVRDIDIARVVEFRGVFEPLADPEFFQQVRVNREIGTIVWPNGADLCPDVLYQDSTIVAESYPSRR